jgi:hypothetical protein
MPMFEPPQAPASAETTTGSKSHFFDTDLSYCNSLDLDPSR